MWTRTTGALVRPGISATLALTPFSSCSSVTRSHEYFLTLFARAKLSVLKVKLQRNFPSELFAVRMYALEPEA